MPIYNIVIGKKKLCPDIGRIGVKYSEVNLVKYSKTDEKSLMGKRVG